MDERRSYRIGETTDAEARERIRLDVLARVRDPVTFDILARVGIRPGWRCLEVGAGSGSVAEWMSTAVGETGSVCSVDVDLRFHRPVAPNVEVRALDVAHDALPDASFDLVHARAVLQHIPERDEVLTRLVAAAKPGGWIVVEDADMRTFEQQLLPDPYGSVHRAMIDAAATRQTWDRNFGARLPELMRSSGLVELGIRGDTWEMRGGEDSGEWWFLAIEHVRDVIPLVSDVTVDMVDAALAQCRAPGFAMLGPLAIAVFGRRPR